VRRVSLALALLLIPPALCAQSLGDAAARERQKREKETGKKPPRSYTNADLRKEEPKKDGDKEGQAAAENAAKEAQRERDERVIEAERTAEESSSSPQGGGARVAQAQAQLDAAQSAVDGIEARIRDLRDKLNPMSGTFIYGPGGSGMPNEEQQIRQDLKDAETQLADVRKALADATQALQDARQGRPAEKPE
jgi:chromosome segregation ATPase